VRIAAALVTIDATSSNGTRLRIRFDLANTADSPGNPCGPRAWRHADYFPAGVVGFAASARPNATSDAPLPTPVAITTY
jgi:hypothetical protein